MFGTRPKRILSPGLWSVLLSLAFAIACTGATDDAVTQADIDTMIETAVATAARSSTPTIPIDIEATAAAAVEVTAAAVVATSEAQRPLPDIDATVVAAVDAGIEAANVELESIIEATVEAAVQATVFAMPPPTPSLEHPTMEPTQVVMTMEQPTATPVATAAGTLPTPTQTSVPQEDPALQEVAIIENYAATRFFPRVIVVLKGIPVRLYLTRLHREHVNQFAIEPFFRSSDVILPGEIGVLNFTPDMAGTFKIRNVGHNFEADLVVVESREEVATFYADRGRQMFALLHSIDDFRIFPEKLTVQEGVPVTVFNISLIAEHRVSFKPFLVPEDINVRPREISMVEFTPDQQGAFTIFHELHGFSGALIVE